MHDLHNLKQMFDRKQITSRDVGAQKIKWCCASCSTSPSESGVKKICLLVSVRFMGSVTI